MINIKFERKDLWLLAAIMVFIVGVGYVIAYNSNMRSGNPAVMGHSAGEVMVENKTGSLVSLQTLIDQGGLGGGSLAFGGWITTDNIGNAFAADLVYKADCDGFISFTAGSAGSGTFIYTDSSNPPTTAVAGSDAINSGEAGNAPVKAGEYVKVSTSGASFTGSIRWRPIGSCDLVKQ